MKQPSGTQLRAIALALLAVAHLVVSLTAVAPGYLSVDEATFHMMVKGVAETGTFEIWNGYRELPSPELASASIVAHDGRLVGQPPYLHPLLGVPFYRLMGYRGLFALNALAFVVAVWLTFLIARRLFGRVELALDACLILVLATFAWEYSQAAWTHATALVFNLAAFYFVVVSVRSAERHMALVAALVAGLFVGLALGVRLDSVLLLAAALIPFLFFKPWRPGSAVALAVGAAPGLVVLSLTNRSKFGTWSPFAMNPEPQGAGASMAPYLPLALAAAVVLVLAFALRGVDLGNLIRSHRRHAVAGVVAIGLLVVALPGPRQIVWRQIAGTYRIVVDMRALSMDREERAMERSDGMAVVYIGGIKKALLQSLPYLPLLLIPAVAVARRENEARQLTLLFLVPLAYTGFYSQYSWHGGLALNQRYLVQTLPFLAVLAAWTLRRLGEKGWIRWGPAVIGGGLAAAVGLLIAEWTFGTNRLIEFQYLAAPLLLAGGVVLALLLALRGSWPTARIAATLGAVLGASLVWASLVALAYDYPLARRTRAHNLRTGSKVAELVTDDAIFFSPVLDQFYVLMESDRVRLARPPADGYADFADLLRFHLDEGRRAYGAFTALQWQILRQSHLEGYRTTEIWQAPGFTLAEISVAPATDV